MAFVEDGVIQQPIYIYRIPIDQVRDNGMAELFSFKDFVARRIEDDGYIAECFAFETECEDGYYRLIARPICFSGFWLDPDD